MKQKGDDYKISAVKYYLNNYDTMDNTCKFFNCKKPSLHRWLQIYKTKKNLQRKPRKSIFYKVKKEQVKTALNMIDKNEQLTMDELLFDMKQNILTSILHDNIQGGLLEQITEPEKEQDINTFLKKDTKTLLIKIENQKFSITK